MRTTLTLDPDVAAETKKGAAKLDKPFKDVVNDALRRPPRIGAFFKNC